MTTLTAEIQQLSFADALATPARTSTRRQQPPQSQRTRRRTIRINDLADAGGKVGAHHPATSYEAADAIAPAKPKQQALVRAYLAAHGPATDQQMQDALHMTPQSQCPRRLELLEKKSIRNSGKTALTRAGRNAILWELTPEALKAVAS